MCCGEGIVTVQKCSCRFSVLDQVFSAQIVTNVDKFFGWVKMTKNPKFILYIFFVSIYW